MNNQSFLNIVKGSGFCHGVSAAVHRADEFAQGEKIYLYGDLVNNRQVMARYIRKGFIVVNSTDEIEENGSVIIRAHGVGKNIYEELARKNVTIVDCTCIKVKKIHEIAGNFRKPPFRIVIIGKKKHPEVLGILGWCENGVVLENENELETWMSKGLARGPVCVVAQTTCNKDFWEKVTAKIKAINPAAEIHNTLCDVTVKRIEAAAEMAKKSDLMLVIGDEKSENSLELFEACKSKNENVLFVSSLNCISCKTNEILGFEKIGMVGSASAPMEIINQIHDFIFFAKYINQAKLEIEAACDKYLKELATEASAKPFINAAIHDFHNQNQGGKRVRGTLIRLGEEIAGNSSTSSTKIAVAYEIFATAILIHDDIIDKSDTRRGKPTIHAAANDQHFGISRAICIGDYGLFLANKILSESDISPEILVKIFRAFSEIQLKTLEGEIMDVSLPHFLPPNSDNIVNLIYEYKTAWYTLIGPMQLGAICGGASDELLQIFCEITLPLGIAYQIKDDLLGIFSSEKKLGKPAVSDLAENKQTLLYNYAVKNATLEQKKRLEKSYGNSHATQTDLETVQEIFTATGAKAFAEAEIERLSQIALSAIEKLQKNKPLLRGLVHFLTVRDF